MTHHQVVIDKYSERRVYVCGVRGLADSETDPIPSVAVEIQENWSRKASTAEREDPRAAQYRGYVRLISQYPFAKPYTNDVVLSSSLRLACWAANIDNH